MCVFACLVSFISVFVGMIACVCGCYLCVFICVCRRLFVVCYCVNVCVVCLCVWLFVYVG